MVGRLTNYVTYIAVSFLGASLVRRPDVVVALTDPPPVGLVGLLVARLRKRPFVLVVKDIFPEVAIQLGVLRNPFVITALKWVQRRLFRGADRLVSIGVDMERRLVELGVPPERIETIHDWSDPALVQPLPRPTQFRTARGWDERFVVMHSGNVGLSQDLDTVLDAAALVADDKRFLFAIVGEGASKKHLEQRCIQEGASNVEFIPFQEKTDLSESLGSADLHLITLRSGLTGYIVPSKLYGVLAAGKPFVAAMDDWSEPARVAREFGCGRVVPPHDAKALADAIRELSESADLSTMGEAGRTALESHFNRARAAESYARLLHSMGPA